MSNIEAALTITDALYGDLRGPHLLEGCASALQTWKGNFRKVLEDYPQARMKARGEAKYFFLYRLMTTSDRYLYNSIDLPPTAALFDGSKMILCWALRYLEPVDDEEVTAARQLLKMGEGETLPMPGTDGWELVYSNDSAKFLVEEIHKANLDATKYPTETGISHTTPLLTDSGMPEFQASFTVAVEQSPKPSNATASQNSFKVSLSMSWEEGNSKTSEVRAQRSLAR